jgi:hypothetical protein
MALSAHSLFPKNHEQLVLQTKQKKKFNFHAEKTKTKLKMVFSKTIAPHKKIVKGLTRKDNMSSS